MPDKVVTIPMALGLILCFMSSFCMVLTMLGFELSSLGLFLMFLAFLPFCFGLLAILWMDITR